MPSVRDLRDRIKSLRNTQQITKAMKQVAGAKIRRAEAARKQAGPYAEAIFAMLKDLMDAVGAVDHPFLRPGKEGAPKGVILMTADKGLAGAFNANIVRAGDQFARDGASVVWYAVGIKARNAARRMSQETVYETALVAGTKLEVAKEVAARIARLHGARSTQILLVDAMRFDVGALVRDGVRRALGSRASLTDELILWSALPTRTMRQLEPLQRGLDALRAPPAARRRPT